MFFSRSTAAHEVNRGVVRESDEERPLLPRGAEQFGTPRQLGENFLKHVARVVLVAGEIQQEGEQRLGVVVVQPFEVGRHRFYLYDARGVMICLAKFVSGATFSVDCT